jgi:hypothetical protein
MFQSLQRGNLRLIKKYLYFDPFKTIIYYVFCGDSDLVLYYVFSVSSVIEHALGLRYWKIPVSCKNLITMFPWVECKSISKVLQKKPFCINLSTL